MSSHLGTNFLNSCLKVPIDPCSNCPAPVYNRPRMYLGRNTTTTSRISSSRKLSDFDLDLDTVFTTGDVRSLAQFYDSIPDYCEVNHLPEEEFYSTLETLKSTCRHLKSNTSPSFCPVHDYSHASSLRNYKPSRESSGKYTKKKFPVRKLGNKKDSRSISVSPCVSSSFRNLFERMRILNYKRFDETDMEKVSEEPNVSTSNESTSIHKSLSVCHLARDEIRPEERKLVNKITQIPDQETTFDEKSASRPNTPFIRDSLRKSFSFNDLNKSYQQTEDRQNATMRFKQYLDEKIKSPSPSPAEVPQIIVNTPVDTIKQTSPKANSQASFFSTRKKKSKPSRSKKTEITKIPFSFLGINETKLIDKEPSASPVHPVARPNLAATLRAEVSKKKVKELQSNCTFQDHTPVVDWEVRKTPAWKSLSLNESHKEILDLRLATRKAEQALQHREYELQMELMRQRVKSAPLLLEGNTFWGPHVGKLSHTCHKDSLSHTCQHERKTRRKTIVPRHQYKKYIPSKVHSRSSNHSTNQNDSDGLSSVDRAYL